MDNIISRVTLKKQWFVSSKLEPIESAYHLGEVLGIGAQGKVYRANSLRLGDTYAIKEIQKSRVTREYETFVREMEILKNLDHPNIIKIQETYETEHLCYLVTDLCEGGNLHEKIMRDRQMTESYAAEIMRKLFSAIAYCHNNGICHRDLKPDNILLLYKTFESDIKLVDFGLANSFSEKELMRSQTGTPLYIAPEVLNQSYSNEVDCWSLGVIMYIMLSGTFPFNGNNMNELFTKILNGSFTFVSPQFDAVSTYAKDLIARLIIKDPDVRLKAEQALKHTWITRHAPLLKKPLSNQIYDNIDRFMSSQKLKRATFMYIAVRVREKEIEDLKIIFENIDQDGNGVLSRAEFEEGLMGIDLIIDDEHLNQLWAIMDTNQNDQIDYLEFISSCMGHQLYTNASYLKSAFEFFDEDKNGEITVDELRRIFNSIDNTMSEERLMKIINEVDHNQDGVINYNEFLAMMAE